MNDKAVIKLGKEYLKEKGISDPYELSVQNMFPKKNYKIITMSFIINTSHDVYDCQYSGVDIETVSSKNYLKYAYRKGSARGGDITFTTNASNISKKLNTILNIQFPKFLRPGNNVVFTEIKLFSSVYSCLKEKQCLIANELEETYNSLPKEDRISVGLSMTIVKDGIQFYLSDFKMIRDQIIYAAMEGKSFKHEVISEGSDSLCSICNRIKPKLHGFASPFKYYTVDKCGFVSNYFRQDYSWKNYPICSDCATELELGRNYIVENLRRSFYGKPYYLIPRLIVDDDSQLLVKALKLLRNYEYKPLDQRQKYIEDYYFANIANEQNYFNLDLMFFEEDPTTKAISIKLMIEEVFPSRFRFIFIDAPQKINRRQLFSSAITVKKEVQDLVFSFGILKDFFEDDFYNLIYRVFIGEKTPSKVLYSRFMSVIRSNYNKMQTTDDYVEQTRVTILKAIMAYYYFMEIGIISVKSHNISEDNMEGNITEQKEETRLSFDTNKLEIFISENQGFLDEDYKIGIFCIGILVKLVMKIQYANLGSTPFEKKLRGFKLNAETLNSIYIDALDKLSQYQSSYAYANLREYINKYYILNSNKLKKISNNELSFYFVAGLEMAGKFKSEKENQ